jgi:hypothetical protein
MARRDVARIATGCPDEEAEQGDRISGVVIGLFLGFNDAGDPLVDYPANPTAGARPARAIASIGAEDRGREAALLFEDGDPSQPILIGLLATPNARAARAASCDDERLVLKANREIVLECGDASITLTRAGKVLIRGTYVLSRSSGVNLITGGVIHLN